LVYVVFSGSGNLMPRSVEDIRTRGAALLSAWGGTDRLKACAQD